MSETVSISEERLRVLEDARRQLDQFRGLHGTTNFENAKRDYAALRLRCESAEGALRRELSRCEEQVDIIMDSCDNVIEDLSPDDRDALEDWKSDAARIRAWFTAHPKEAKDAE